jgi:hypothetical protein
MVILSQLSRVGVALSLLMLIASLIVSSTSVRFVLAAVMAAAAVLPVVCGPMRYRLVGIVALAAGIGLAWSLYPAYKGDPPT